jgi:hypothetical protein
MAKSYDARPIEGIDKVSVLLNPLILNSSCKKKHVDPLNRLTLHKSGAFTTLVIHQEFFNPFFDYQKQIAFAVYELVKHGIINFPDTIFTPFIIYEYHSLFILNVVALEFYSSWASDEIEVNEDMSKTTLAVCLP